MNAKHALVSCPNFRHAPQMGNQANWNWEAARKRDGSRITANQTKQEWLNKQVSNGRINALGQNKTLGVILSKLSPLPHTTISLLQLTHIHITSSNVSLTLSPIIVTCYEVHYKAKLVLIKLASIKHMTSTYAKRNMTRICDKDRSFHTFFPTVRWCSSSCFSECILKVSCGCSLLLHDVSDGLFVRWESFSSKYSRYSCFISSFSSWFSSCICKNKWLCMLIFKSIDESGICKITYHMYHNNLLLYIYYSKEV